MKENKKSKPLIATIIILLVLLIAIWAIFFVLNGRSTPVPSSSISAVQAPTSTNESSSSYTSSNESSASYYDDDMRSFFVTEVPPGPYVSVDETNLELLTGNWYYSHNLASTGNLDLVYGYEFDAATNFIDVGQGLWIGEGTVMYLGEFTLQSPGIITASLSEIELYADESAPPLSTAEITIRLEWPENNYDILIATIESVTSDKPNFEQQFDAIIGVACPYFRLPQSE